jgi:hypothetical protein
MAETVAWKAWQDMQMNVKDFLPGCFSVCEEKVDPFHSQP